MMKNGVVRNAGLAALLSAVFPGLGQFYNRQAFKGVGFLSGALMLAIVLLTLVDPRALQRAALSGVPPDNLGRLFLTSILLLAVALWSVVDAASVAKRSPRSAGERR